MVRISHRCAATLSFIVWIAPANAQSLIGCIPPTGMPSEDFVCLDNYDTRSDLIWRSIGQINFTNSIAAAFVPFPTGGPVDPHAGGYADVAFRSFYGDRLGYEASGLFDVDGDGFSDWATTWYDAKPVDALTNTPRVPPNAYVMPVISALSGSTALSHTAADLATRTTWNKVGMARVYSGRDNSQIGQEMWSHRGNAIAPHEIGPLRDIDGDGRDELILSANTYNWTRGGLYVMSYSNKYNAPGDTTERWVCILLISGINGSSEFAYELEDTQSDFNNDGQNDIVAASTFWRVDGQRTGANPNTTGAGWIFLTPPKQVFEDIQKSTTWPTDPLRDNVKRPLELVAEIDYNLCVMQLDDTTGMPIDVENDVPPGAAALRVGSIGDLADAGDLDGDGRTDFTVFGSYRYDDNGTQVTTGAIYFMLSGDGFGSTGYTLHDKQSRIIGIAPDQFGVDAPVEDPNYVGVAVDIYQDAEVVFHGDDERTYGNNRRSYFGRMLDSQGDADMALVTYRNGNYGLIHILLDGQEAPRFSPTGSIGSSIPPAGQRPLAISYDDPIIAPDHTITASSLYASDGVTLISMGNITGLGTVGDYDGDGDEELSIQTLRSYRLGSDNPNFSLITTANVLDIPSGAGVPTVERSYQHETPIYHSINNPLTGSAYGSAGMNWRGLKAQAAFDLDKDGRDDVLMHTAATPQKVLWAPDPFGSNSPVLLFDESDPLFDGYRPYQIEGQGEGGGSTHVALSPASEPSLIGGRSLYSLDNQGNQRIHITLNVDRISPEIDPASFLADQYTYARQFDHNEFVVELVSSETAAACQSVVVQAIPLSIAGATAPRRLSFSFPMAGCSASPASMLLRVRSRWINDDPMDPGYGQPWITPVPGISGVLFPGGLAP